MKNEKRLITAALPYINNIPHMGHIVGCHLPADIFYRFCKLKGYDVKFIGGSDEHGTPSVLASRELNLPTQDFVDKLHIIHKKIYEKFNIDYSLYSRTSKQEHHKKVQDFFKKLKENGYIQKKKSKMLFCTHDNFFLPDRYLVGTCPNCGYTEANNDQCEKCSSLINPGDLVNPKCKICGSTPIYKETEHYYIELDKLEDKLSEWIEDKKEIWRKNVYSEAQRWIKSGLAPIAITRDMTWGISVLSEDIEEKVFYVWFDATIGYISFTEELGEFELQKFWKNEDTKIYHFLGKDNIPFHTIFWPAMLLGNGEYNLPYNVVGSHFLNFEGQKFSKSKNIGVFCYPVLEAKINIDLFRAYLVTILPETKDSNFVWEDFRNCINGEFAGKIGNLFNRTLSMIQKNFAGQVDYKLSEFELTEDDGAFIEEIKNTINNIDELYEKIEFRKVFQEIIRLATLGNVYIEKNEPWKKIKNGDIKLAQKILYLLLNLCKNLAILLYPIIPEIANEFWQKQMNFSESIGKNENIWQELGEFNISHNHCINQPYPIFQLIDENELEELKEQFSKSPDLNEIL